MAKPLPAPEVVRTSFDEGFEPALPALVLRWPPDGVGERLWSLPEDVTVFGPPPRRFGVSIRRHGPDAYGVRLLWDHTSLAWKSLSRVQLLASALAPVLAALGSELLSLLDQPIPRPPRTARTVAA
jgi:hypothetical protein